MDPPAKHETGHERPLLHLNTEPRGRAGAHRHDIGRTRGGQERPESGPRRELVVGHAEHVETSPVAHALEERLVDYYGGRTMEELGFDPLDVESYRAVMEQPEPWEIGGPELEIGLPGIGVLTVSRPCLGAKHLTASWTLGERGLWSDRYGHAPPDMCQNAESEWVADLSNVQNG